MRVPFTRIDIAIPLLPKRRSVRAELDAAARLLDANEAERIRRGEKGTQPTEASLARGKREAVQTQARWQENRRNQRESIW